MIRFTVVFRQARSACLFHGQQRWRSNASRCHSLLMPPAAAEIAKLAWVTGSAIGIWLASRQLQSSSTSCDVKDIANNESLPLAVLTLPSDLTDELCNSGDDLSSSEIWAPQSKLLWHVRHGQSTGNVAKEIALAADKKEGCRRHGEAYQADYRHADAFLTETGEQQARLAKAQVAKWRLKPSLIVCSPLTRAIQTAAIMFEQELEDGTARLVIRPELREVFPLLPEDRGRTITELRSCHRLRALARWSDIEQALSDEATSAWRDNWDSKWAKGADGAWQAHCRNPQRFSSFMSWLSSRSESMIAIVSHWGTINNMLNREPWVEGYQKILVPEWFDKETWPDGLGKRFNMPNCGWVAVHALPHVHGSLCKL